MKSTAWSKFDNDVVTKLLTWFVLFTTGKTCPLYAGPKNGALACNTIASDIVCVVMCNSGFDFEFNPPMLYYCVEGEWAFYSLSSYSYPQQLPWPDCSSKLTSLLIKTISRTKAPSSRIRIFLNPQMFSFRIRLPSTRIRRILQWILRIC